MLALAVPICKAQLGTPVRQVLAAGAIWEGDNSAAILKSLLQLPIGQPYLLQNERNPLFLTVSSCLVHYW